MPLVGTDPSDPRRGREPDLVQRLVVGPVLIVAGIAILAGLILLRHLARPSDWFQAAGLLLAALAYSTIGTLFMLLGLQYVLGERSWISQWLRSSLRNLAATAIVMAGTTIAALCVIYW